MPGVGEDGCIWFDLPPVSIPCTSCPFKQIEGHCLLYDSPKAWPEKYFKRLAKMTQDEKNHYGFAMAQFLFERKYFPNEVKLILSSVMGKIVGTA